MKCMVCKTPQRDDYDIIDLSWDVVCGECNENFEGTFNGDRPTFYALMGSDYVIGLQVEAHLSDRRVVGPLNLENVGSICGCPRDETRWNTGECHHL
jgi:hypothetical protein